MHLLNGDVVAQHRMVGAARGDPALDTRPQVGHGLPHNTRDWQVRHGKNRLYGLDVLHDEAKPAAHVDKAHDDGLAGLSFKDKSGGVFFIHADAEVMRLDARTVGSQARADLQHMTVGKILNV